MSSALDSAFEQFFEGCADLGLPAWRVDPVRREWRGPADGNLHGIASSERLIGAIATLAAGREAGQEPYLIHEWGPGVGLLLIRERVRRERFGWVATVLPSAGCGASLAGVCDMKADEIEALLAPAFFPDQSQADRFARMLLRLHQRSLEACENEAALEDFTTQLTMAYESAVMTGNVAKSMNRVDDPIAFLTQAVDEVFASLPFGWVSLVRGNDPALAGVMVGPAISRFDPKRFDAPVLEQASASILEVFGEATRLSIEPCPFGLDETLGPEIVVHPIVIEGSTRAVLALGARAGDDWAVSSYDTLPVSAVAASISVFLEIVLAYRHQQESFMGTLRGLTRALDAKDAYTRGHSDRVAHVAERLALAAGLDEAAVRQVRIAGMVHDIGKIGVPESVLQGTRKLTDDEFAQVRRHPGIGYEILQGIPMLSGALPGVLHHHERWDGRGYPAGIAGEDIPLIARLLGLADAFDAMSSNRKYQTGQERETVLAEIRACSGKHFDPQLVDRFMELDLSEYDRMLEQEARDAPEAGDARSAA